MVEKANDIIKKGTVKRIQYNLIDEIKWFELKENIFNQKTEEFK